MAQSVFDIIWASRVLLYIFLTNELKNIQKHLMVSFCRLLFIFSKYLLLKAHQLFDKTLIGPNTRPPLFNKLIGLLIPYITFLHQIGNNKSSRPGYSMIAMDIDITTLPTFVNDIKCPVKIFIGIFSVLISKSQIVICSIFELVLRNRLLAD